MSTKHDDIHVFTKAVTFQGPVTFSEDPPEFSLDNVADLAITGDLIVGDDLVVTDDATVSGDLAVAGASALHNTAVTGTLSTSGAATLASAVVTAGATVGTTLAVAGATTLAAATASGTVTCNGTLDCNGSVDLSGATITMPTGFALAQKLEVAFVLLDITGGAKASASLPTNTLILGAYIDITTALTFADADTTNVTAKIGNSVDDDGYGVAVALAGTEGKRRPTPGALVGGLVAGESGGLVCTFTASAGNAPSLAGVTAGAGKIVVYYITVT